MPPINEKLPVIVVKKLWFEEFAAGRKTTEYRRYGRLYTERTFYAGRRVRIAYNYDLTRSSILSAIVTRFDRVRAGDLSINLSVVYPDIRPDDLVALIHLSDIEQEPGSRSSENRLGRPGMRAIGRMRYAGPEKRRLTRS